MEHTPRALVRPVILTVLLAALVVLGLSNVAWNTPLQAQEVTVPTATNTAVTGGGGGGGGGGSSSARRTAQTWRETTTAVVATQTAAATATAAAAETATAVAPTSEAETASAVPPVDTGATQTAVSVGQTQTALAVLGQQGTATPTRFPITLPETGVAPVPVRLPDTSGELLTSR